jgi:hypothetical protein
MRAKGAVVGGFEGSQNDGPKNIVDGESAHVLKRSADIVYFAEVGVNNVLGVAIPGHEASDLTVKEDSLHTLVLEGESCQKSFPYLLIAQKLGRAVLVKNGDHRDTRLQDTMSSRRSRSCSYTYIHDSSFALSMTRSS